MQAVLASQLEALLGARVDKLLARPFGTQPGSPCAGLWLERPIEPADPAKSVASAVRLIDIHLRAGKLTRVNPSVVANAQSLRVECLLAK